MRRVLMAAALSAMALASSARAGDAAVDAALRKFGEAFNKGDIAAARALHVPAPIIVDEPAPHLWTGPKAFDTWIADLAKSEAAEGKTDGQVAIGAPTREVISGPRAYVIAPSTYTYKQSGRTFRETAQMTFVLKKSAAGWKIAAWTWTGPEGAPVD